MTDEVVSVIFFTNKPIGRTWLNVVSIGRWVVGTNSIPGANGINKYNSGIC